MRAQLLLLTSCFLTPAALGCATDTEPPAATAPIFVQGPSPEEVGRYLFLAGGCNDCHTPGWSESDGKLPEAEWALGSEVGYRGPWGTSYAQNLRLAAAARTPRQWVSLFRQSAGLPPMPWPNYRAVAEQDSGGHPALPDQPRRARKVRAGHRPARRRAPDAVPRLHGEDARVTRAVRSSETGGGAPLGTLAAPC